MTSLNDILRLLGQAADKVDDYVPQVGVATPVIRGAQALADAFDNFKTANGEQAPPEAQASRDEKLQRVLDHANSTADRLEGKT